MFSYGEIIRLSLVHSEHLCYNKGKRGKNMSENSKRKLLGATASVTLVVFFSKVVGFLREMIMAYVFGANADTDAYNSAYSLFYLPVLLFSSWITTSMVPQYARAREELDERGLNRFTSNALSAFCLLSLAISALMFLAASPLVRLVYPGFSGEKLELTVTLTRVMLPALVFFIASLVFTSVLNARGRFVAAQTTGFPLSVAEIFAAMVLAKKYGINAQAWSVIAAGILQCVILIPFLRGVFSYSPTLDLKDARFKRLIVLGIPAMLSMAVTELNHMIDRVFASGLNDGDITAMTYSFRPIMVMLGVLTVPLTTVSFTRMSVQSARSDTDGLRTQIRTNIKLMLALVLPLAIIAAVQSQNIIRLAYGRGSFSDRNVYVTGLVFMFYVVGLPFLALRDLTNRVYHAFEATRITLVYSIISVAVNVVLNLLLRKRMGINGLALATGISAFVNVVLLFTGLSKELPHVLTLSFLRELVPILLAGGAVLGSCLYLSRLLDQFYSTASGTWNVFLRLCEVTVTCLGIDAVFLMIFGEKDIIKTILKRIKKKIKR